MKGKQRKSKVPQLGASGLIRHSADLVLCLSARVFFFFLNQTAVEVEVLKSTLGHNTHLWRWLPKHLFIKKISLFQATKTTFLKSHTEFERLMGISTVSLKNVNNILGARTTNKYLFFSFFFFLKK